MTSQGLQTKRDDLFCLNGNQIDGLNRGKANLLPAGNDSDCLGKGFRAYIESTLMSKMIPLTELPRELRAAGFNPPSYRTAYIRVVEAAIPAERVNGRFWMIKSDDLAAIAEAMNLQKLDGMAA